MFRLVDPDDVDLPVQLDDRYGDLRDSVLKLRRWHGLLDPQGSGGPHVLEDGISVELPSGGSYRPGQYWQYEARVRGENANGPWRPRRRTARSGASRRWRCSSSSGDAEPLRLLAWLDERFSHVCELDADDIDFAGERVGTESDTVQEALEEIYERLPADRALADGGRRAGSTGSTTATLPLPRFNEGLRVTFSEEMHPATATPAAFVVALEVPAEEGAPGLRRSLVVNGRVDVDGSSWTFVPSTLDEGDVGRWVRDLDGPVRCRVRLASHVILDRAGERPLDGDTVGRVRRGRLRRVDRPAAAVRRRAARRRLRELVLPHRPRPARGRGPRQPGRRREASRRAPGRARSSSASATTCGSRASRRRR